ncbi:hypothetical protein BAE44_0014427 [Dichanthelium oligosanthes]|uniref:Uncharacterized protein n=1 Tax=Dichanthelium oligosanthes TaxID=888268 RepID=A0A1E5VHF5_9POAL|nr:hypothetical protein BAE44_0014427 [Dichanthelium oligosanthes]
MRVRGLGDGEASSIDLVGLSGDVVRRIPVLEERHDYGVLGTRSDCVFLRGANDHGISVLDPATGSVRALPAGAAEDLAFGQVSSTGEYKLLRILQDHVPEHHGTAPLCEVFTFGKGFEQWRKNQSPPFYLNES